MKCDAATIDAICSQPGAKSLGMGPGKPSGDHIASSGKLIGTREETTPMKKHANKYRAVPTIYNGVRYASKSEAARAKVLDQLQASGVIKFWIGQPKFRLGVPENVYIADALVVTNDGAVRVEDVKGVESPKFRRDKSLWRAYGPCDLVIIRNGKVAEIIVPEKTREDVA